MSERTFETTGSLKSDLELDLDDCHTDPIHQSAHIQPHGTFLEVDPDTLNIRSAAENASAFLNGDASHFIGQSLDTCFNEETLNELRTYINQDFPQRKHFVSQKNGSSLSLYAFQIGNQSPTVGIDIEENQDKREGGQELLTNINDQLQALQGIIDRDSLYERVLEYLSSFTEYDRLMIYQFDEEGHGTVVAERKNDVLESYLGHQFPASDIPEPARRLYKKNPLRIIPNAQENPVPILGPDGPRNRQELNLTYSSLRAVPSVHREYMKNMGVTGSLSVSLMAEDDLWGLISCHATSSYSLSWSQKSACEFIARSTSQQLATISSQEREKKFEQVIAYRESLDTSFTTHEELFDKLEGSSESVLSLMEANGFYLELDGESFWSYTDSAIQKSAQQLLPDLQKQLQDQKNMSVRSIVEEYDKNWTHSSILSGFLAWRLSSSAHSYCVWFRPEHQRTIEWGGDPRNPVNINDEGRLSPRNSFDTWTQIVSKQCQRWTDLDQFTARETSRVFKELEIELQKSLLQKTNQKIKTQNELLERTKNRLEKINNEKEELLQRVQEMARTDDLTGLSTRDELMKLLSNEIDRSRRYNHSLSLMFIDLDHFKHINDRYGHQTGDEVLEVFGELLREHSRTSDLLGRYGGEEFIAAFPNTSLDEAKAFAERVLESQRQHTFESDEGSFQVTCSIGLTELQCQDDAEQIIDRADDALYQAKNSGRDTLQVKV